MLKKYLFVLPFTLAGLVSNAQTVLDNKTVNAVPATHLDFDGANDYVNCGNAPAVQISGNAITLEARVKFNSFAGSFNDGSIINKEQNSPDYGYMLRAGSSGIVNLVMWSKIVGVFHKNNS